MARLAVPIVSCVIGEGGSGGALAIGVGDRLLMLQYSVYSVISPEGCASILWKSAGPARARRRGDGHHRRPALKLGLVDEIIPEPLGGAHREPQVMAERLRDTLTRHLERARRAAGRRAPRRTPASGCAGSGSTAEPEVRFGAECARSRARRHRSRLASAPGSASRSPAASIPASCCTRWPRLAADCA